MLLPKGRPIHQDLGTAYVKLDHLIKDLAGEGFSGYLELETPQFSGIIFFEQGKISGAYSDPPSENPLMTLMEEASKEGTLNVYALPTEVVYILSTAIGGEKIFKDLPMEIINLDGLLSYLARENFTGTVKVEAEDSLVMILLFEGEPLELICEGEEGVVQGEEVWTRLERFKQSPHAVLSLFKSVERERKVEFDPQGIRNSIKSFFQLYVPAVEKLLGQGKFGRLFREVSLELADSYPFMDPFAPQVVLKEDGLVIGEEVSVVDLLEGMRELVGRISQVVKEQKGRDALTKMIQELKLRLKGEPYLGAFWEAMERAGS